jgi:hypothetical protein
MHDDYTIRKPIGYVCAVFAPLFVLFLTIFYFSSGVQASPSLVVGISFLVAGVATAGYFALRFAMVWSLRRR